MVIAKGRDGIGVFVTLTDGEFLPENLNDERVVVFRQGDSTNRELKLIKEFGKLADKSLLRPPDPPFCNYSGDGNPLHEHADGTWWFYEETWIYESGPYDTLDLGWAALTEYCEKLQAARKDLTTDAVVAIMETDGIQTHPEAIGS